LDVELIDDLQSLLSRYLHLIGPTLEYDSYVRVKYTNFGSGASLFWGGLSFEVLWPSGFWRRSREFFKEAKEGKNKKEVFCLACHC
jgi:hypothetical protein